MRQRYKRLLGMLFCLVLSVGSTRSSCTSQPYATVTTDKNPVYLHRRMRQGLSLECMLLDARCSAFSTAGNISLSWDIPLGLQHRAEIPNTNAANTGSKLPISSLGEEDNGNYNISCTITHTAADGVVSNVSSNLNLSVIGITA